MLCFLLFSRMGLGVASQEERVLYVRSVYLHGAGQKHRMVRATGCESPLLRYAAGCRLPLPHIESPLFTMRQDVDRRCVTMQQSVKACHNLLHQFLWSDLLVVARDS
jgi:hypothetical protein